MDTKNTLGRIAPRVSARVAAMLLLAVSGSAFGQVVFNSGASSYSENFNGLLNTGANTVLNAWSQNTTVSGWYLYTYTGLDIPTFRVDTGAGTSGSFYSYGSAASTDRALGSLGSGNTYFGTPAPGGGAVAGYIAFALTNNTGNSFDTINVGFNGEQWRNGGNATAQTMVFEYGFGATFGAVATWIAPGGSFNFTSPVTGTTAAAVDGNVAGLVSGRGGALTGLSVPTGTTVWFRWIERNDTGNDHGLALDDFTVSLANSTIVAQNVTWTGAASRNWNTTEGNFTGGTGSVYSEQFDPGLGRNVGDNVTFGDTGAGPITISAGGVSPTSVTVNSSANYEFTGGPITGPSPLTKSGTGTLRLSANNTMSGAVTINGGTVSVGSAGALGTGAVTVNGGALSGDVSFSINSLTIGAGGIDLSPGAGTTITLSTVTSLGTNGTPAKFLKTNSGSVKFSLPFPQASGSPTTSLAIFDGSLVLTQSATSNNIFIDPQWATSTAGDLVLQTPVRTSFSGLLSSDIGNPNLTSTGNIIFRPGITPATSQIQSFSAVGSSSVNVNLGIVFEDGPNTKYGISAGLDGATLRLKKPVSGTGTLVFATSRVAPAGGTTYYNGGTGTVELYAPSTYSGDTFVNLDFGGTVKSMVANPLPTGTALNLGDANLPDLINGISTSVGAYDVNGFNLTVGSLKSSAAPAVIVQGLVNRSSTVSTVTLTGSTTAGFGAPISGPIVIATTSTFTGTQTLSGVISTPEGVSVGGGTLIIATPTSISQKVLDVNSIALTGGVLQLPAVVRGTDLPRVIVADTLSVGGGFLDLTNNDAVFQSATLTSISNAVKSWWNNGLRNGAGIGSSLATLETVTTIGVIQASSSSVLGSIDGVGLSGTDIVAKYTYLGDTDLSGSLDSTDLNALIAGIRLGLTGWANGDTNYDGVVDSIDFANLLTAMRYQGTFVFNNSGVSTGEGSAGVIPEPAALGLVIAALPMLSRRRRA